MTDSEGHAVAIVGVGAILPDAPDARTFWANLVAGRSSITDVPKERWDPELYYDADPMAPDKSYSKIGGWVRDWDWSPLAWHLPIPPGWATPLTTPRNGRWHARGPPCWTTAGRAARSTRSAPP